jgi:hypothetical protein
MLTFISTDQYFIELCPVIAGVRLDMFDGIEDTHKCDIDDLSAIDRLHISMYYLADKYSVPSLVKEAYARFGRAWFGLP